MIKSGSKIIALWIMIAFSIFLFLYSFSLQYFFFQDDFFEINISKANNFGEYLQFFKFRDDIIAYRPISLQNYFFFSSELFGYNPIGFRLITFSFIIGCAYLIFRVSEKITNNIYTGLMAAALWLTSSIHFMSVTWIAAAYNIIGTFFWLLTGLFFLRYIKNHKFKSYLLSIGAYLLAVGSFEFSVTWPIIFSIYYFLEVDRRTLKVIRIFSPFLIISIVYLLGRLLFIRIPQITEYQIILNFESIKALFWYFLWALNIPEEFKKQVVTLLVVFNRNFLKEYWLLIVTSTLSAMLILSLAVGLPLFKLVKSSTVNFKLLSFFMFWFLIALSPVLILPNHTFSMYLTLPSIGLYMLISHLLIMQKKPMFTALVLLVWLVSSYTTISFYKNNSWVVEAQSFSKYFAFQIKNTYPTFPHNSIVFYKSSDQRHKQALQGSNALRSIYDDQTLSIYYNKKELLNFIKNKKVTNIYVFNPQ